MSDILENEFFCIYGKIDGSIIFGKIIIGGFWIIFIEITTLKIPPPEMDLFYRCFGDVLVRF